MIFRKIIDQSVYPPYKIVACGANDFLQKNNKFSIIKKYLSRYIRLLIGGQIGLEVCKIPLDSRILWLHVGKRNIGDALIEASGRLLLKSANVKIDLLTLPNLEPIFFDDDVFINKYINVSEVDGSSYDYILLTEFNHRTIKLKNKYFKKLPYASLFRYFYGPDRNQTMFSFAAVNNIFELGLDDDLLSLAKPYMHVESRVVEKVSKLLPDSPFIVVSVGGIDQDRTYKKWDSFLHLLNDSAIINEAANVILLGSENGIDESEYLLSLTFSRLNVCSYVGKLSLQESQTVIAHSLRFVGCDGGLMHIAHTTSTPTVVIFSKEKNYLRLTPKCYATPLQGVSDVNDISPSQVINGLQQSLSFFAERH
jgi:heptosyltransferase-2